VGKPPRDLNVLYNLACYWAEYASQVDKLQDDETKVEIRGAEARKRALECLKGAVGASQDSTSEDVLPNLKFYSWEDPSLETLIRREPRSSRTRLGLARQEHCRPHAARQGPPGGVKTAGIETIDALILQAATPDLRTHLAWKSGLSDKQLFDAAVIAEMTRVAGIKASHAQLLRATGKAKSLKQLGKVQDVDEVFLRLPNANKKLAVPFKTLPERDHIAQWIQSASKLQSVVQPHQTV
jgi:hypothetical protein